MNILILTNELRHTCGVTNHLLHLTKGLSEIKGNRLWIICGGGNGIKRFTNIKVTIINDERFLHETRNISSYMSAIAFLTIFVIKNKIDIIHSHSHYSANIARNASRFAGTPTIQTNHGLLAQNGRLNHFNADRYVAVNEHISDYILNNRISMKSKISFIRCGIPIPESFPYKESLKLKVLAASRLSHEKGLDLYITAVSKLSNETKYRARFYIAGEGELRNELIKMNKEYGADITFLGRVGDMYKLLRSCHILVYPSRSHSEGFPAVITEAGANGLVVISSNFPGVGSVLNDNIDGIVFKMEDASALADKLSKVINKFENYRHFSERLYSRTKRIFSLGKMIDKHQRLYGECLK